MPRVEYGAPAIHELPDVVQVARDLALAEELLFKDVIERFSEDIDPDWFWYEPKLDEGAEDRLRLFTFSGEIQRFNPNPSEFPEADGSGPEYLIQLREFIENPSAGYGNTLRSSKTGLLIGLHSLGGGEYAGSTLSAANRSVFEEQFEDGDGEWWFTLAESYSFEMPVVAVPLVPADQAKRLVEALEQLEQGGFMQGAEERMSEMETEEAAEAMDANGWYTSDAIHTLENSGFHIENRALFLEWLQTQDYEIYSDGSGEHNVVIRPSPEELINDTIENGIDIPGVVRD